MTQKQINYLNMMEAVTKCLNDNATAWTTITPIADEVAKLTPITNKIKAAYKKQTEENTVGYTDNKDIALENMETLAYALAIKVKAYARKAGDMVLFNAVDFSMTDLTHGSEKEQITHCQIIADSATANLASLTAYGVTAPEIAALQTSINTAEPLTATRDAVMGEHVESTSELSKDFKAARAIFITLDELVEALTPAAFQEFENTYFATRRINDHRGGGGKSTTPTPPTN